MDGYFKYIFTDSAARGASALRRYMILVVRKNKEKQRERSERIDENEEEPT